LDGAMMDDLNWLDDFAINIILKEISIENE